MGVFINILKKWMESIVVLFCILGGLFLYLAAIGLYLNFCLLAKEELQPIGEKSSLIWYLAKATAGTYSMLMTPFAYTFTAKSLNLFYLLITFVFCEISQGLSIGILIFSYISKDDFWLKVPFLLWAIAIGLYVLMNTINHILLMYHTITRSPRAYQQMTVIRASMCTIISILTTISAFCCSNFDEIMLISYTLCGLGTFMFVLACGIFENENQWFLQVACFSSWIISLFGLLFHSGRLFDSIHEKNVRNPEPNFFICVHFFLIVRDLTLKVLDRPIRKADFSSINTNQLNAVPPVRRGASFCDEDFEFDIDSVAISD